MIHIIIPVVATIFGFKPLILMLISYMVDIVEILREDDKIICKPSPT